LIYVRLLMWQLSYGQLRAFIMLDMSKFRNN